MTIARYNDQGCGQSLCGHGRAGASFVGDLTRVFIFTKDTFILFSCTLIKISKSDVRRAKQRKLREGRVLYDTRKIKK